MCFWKKCLWSVKARDRVVTSGLQCFWLQRVFSSWSVSLLLEFKVSCSDQFCDYIKNHRKIKASQVIDDRKTAIIWRHGGCSVAVLLFTLTQRETSYQQFALISGKLQPTTPSWEEREMHCGRSFVVSEISPFIFHHLTQLLYARSFTMGFCILWAHVLLSCITALQSSLKNPPLWAYLIFGFPW